MVTLRTAFSKTTFNSTISVSSDLGLDLPRLQQTKAFGLVDEIRTEIIRKSLHFLIALVPSIAFYVGTEVTFGLLSLGVLFYSFAEFFRYQGFRIPIISRLTELASRERDKNTFVLGPVTLGLGAMISIMLYPNPAAAVAVYALAFGDGFASLIGKLAGSIRIPFTGGKSVEGSVACFLAVLLPSAILLDSVVLGFTVAMFATIIEAIPSKDFDNILMPTAVGAFVMMLPVF
jgi:phytol kinase